jgi:hypothetical protein
MTSGGGSFGGGVTLGGGVTGGGATGRGVLSGAGFGCGLGVTSGSGSGFCLGRGVAGSGIGVAVGVGWDCFGLGFGFGELSGDGVSGTVFISSRAFRNWSFFSSSVVCPSKTEAGSIHMAINSRKGSRTRRMLSNQLAHSSGAALKDCGFRIEDFGLKVDAAVTG